MRRRRRRKRGDEEEEEGDGVRRRMRGRGGGGGGGGGGGCGGGGWGEDDRTMLKRMLHLSVSRCPCLPHDLSLDQCSVRCAHLILPPTSPNQHRQHSFRTSSEQQRGELFYMQHMAARPPKTHPCILDIGNG